MDTKYISRIFEMLHFYSDTFARLSLANVTDVGKIGTTLISSILNYRAVVLLLEGVNKEPELLAIKGLSQNFISAWKTEEDLVRYLWREIDFPTIVKCDNLETKISSSAKRLGLEDMFLTVPFKQSVEHKEKRIGLAIAALPPNNYELNIDIMTLDIIASHIGGAITTCKMRMDLIEINKELELDVTERKKVEEELRLSEEKFRELFEQAGDHAFILNLSDESGLVIMDANEAACKMHGYTREELVGMSMTELDPELSNERISERLQCLLSGKTLKFETVHYRKDGTSFPLEVCTKAVKIAGRPLFIFSTERDITERKKAEEEKYRLEEQLQHAQKMEAIGTLAGGVAHDFNNLLTAIIGYGNLLKTEVVQNDLLMAYVNQILNSAERAANLTHNLLSFSRKQIITLMPINVNNIINSMKSFIQRIIGEDIELSIITTDQNLTVMADSHQIEQVLMNLLTNARDAMPDGGNLTIRTGYREIDDEFINKHGYIRTGSYAIISIEDTGHGMDEETKERLFDPFFTTKEVGKGTGLGLSMSYGIIKQHNGYIDVQSKYGKGTTFNIYLPLTIPTVEEDKKPEDLTILKGGNETILVAEDETYVRDFLKEILTAYGYKVIEAIDGKDAIRKFNKQGDTIQLLILDVVMPKKDGKMVYQEINKVSPDTKIIFISGYATDILHKKGVIEEGIDFISKPMSPNELLIKVREVLDS